MKQPRTDSQILRALCKNGVYIMKLEMRLDDIAEILEDNSEAPAFQAVNLAKLRRIYRIAKMQPYRRLWPKRRKR